ncbi:hypothetical protein JCM11251_007536 [Rhodosporidiobolus azoricus]
MPPRRFVRLALQVPLRQFNTSTRCALPPRRASVPSDTTEGRKSKEGSMRIDATGMERRPLAPLGRDGKSVLSQAEGPAEDSTFEDCSAAEPSNPFVKSEPSSSRTPLEPLERLPQKKGRKPRRKKDAGESEEDDRSRMTPLERAVRDDLEKYPESILLTQVGSFFESYFDQARLVAKLLNIKLTSKVFGRISSADRSPKKTRHPFCGFPLAQLDKHVSTLIQEGHKVVIVEEYKKLGDETIYRKVTRQVTPGTGVDEDFVAAEQMNYVLALGVVDGKSVQEEVGLAYRDVSTGASFTRKSKLRDLRDNIKLVNPKEVVVDSRLSVSKLGGRVIELLEGEHRREGLLISSASTDGVPSSSSAIRTPTSAAEDVLLAYLAATLVATPLPRNRATFIDPASVMQMDAVTLQSLEIRESLRGGLRGSLLGAVKRTVTPGGLRLLSERLCNPSTELPVIHTRHDLVASFLSGLPQIRPHVIAILKTLDDTPRLLQRLALHRPNAADDLVGLKRTMRAVVDIRESAFEAVGDQKEQYRGLVDLVEKLGHYAELAAEIEAAVDEEALAEREAVQQRKADLVEMFGDKAWEKEKDEEAVKGREDGLWGESLPWVIRPDFSSALAERHAELVSLRQQADELQSSLRTKYRSPSLTLRNVLKIGAGVHVLSREGISKIDGDSKTTMVQKSGSTRVYVLQDWVNLHTKIIKLQETILELEKEAMQILIARTLERYDDLLATADALAELDVCLGFAELAVEQEWVRPEVNESKSLEIIGGRHPTVEAALRIQNRQFDPNDVRFDHPDDSPSSSSLVHVLTGPNMAGKSTHLRLTALLVVLAQAGSFVPATAAQIGIFDRVFSRVGARDELDRDRSTFMIEMDETTSILDNATSRSLVLLDELGRGTSPLDGISIAYAALEHLTHVNRSRTLFATHFHRLGPLLGYQEGQRDALKGKAKWDGVEFWCTDVEVDEVEASVRFPHSIRRGLNPDSGGLIVARLAGMPESVVGSAKTIRDMLREEGREGQA